ncbi:MAG: SDR family oxidoreductase [Amphritea sp.]
MKGVDNQTVVITGASRGIGLAIARAFVEAGAKVTIIAENEEVGTAASEIGAMGRQADITDSAAVATVLAAVCPIDVLINNAGLERITPVDDVSCESIALFRRVIDINITGTAIVTGQALEQMGEGARIINTASIWGRTVEPLFGAYVASKHAVVGLTKTWAKELGPRGIRVNGVAPGWVRTEASVRSAQVLATRSGKSEQEIIGVVEAAQALAGGFMEPDDIVGVYLFLASDLSNNITGQTIGVDRGEMPW